MMSDDLRFVSYTDFCIRFDKVIDSVERNLEVTTDFFHCTYLSNV